MAREIKELGFRTLWIAGESPDLAHASELHTATDALGISTSIVNVWQGEPTTASETYLRVAEQFPDRFLLGLVVGHREQNLPYVKPMTALNRYLDVQRDGRRRWWISAGNAGSWCQPLNLSSARNLFITSSAATLYASENVG